MAEITPLFLTEEPDLQDLTLDLHEPENGTAAASDLTLSSSGNAPGEYSTTVTTALTGLHRASVKSAGTVIAIYEVILYDITDKLSCVELGTAAAREAAAYPGRRIYIDTVNGSAGTVPCENGTVNQPVKTWNDAKTLAETLGYTEFYVVSGSTLTLSSSAAGYNFNGENYSFYPNGYDIGGTIVRNALVYMSVSSATTTSTELIDCRISQLIISVGIELHNCFFISGSENEILGACKFYNCRADTLQSNPPIFDFQGSGSLPSNTAIFIDWVGDLRIKRIYYGAYAHIYGRGIITIDSDCTGGVIRLLGNLETDDNVSGGFDNLTNGSLDYFKQPVDVAELNKSAAAAEFFALLNRAGLLLVVDTTDEAATLTTFETTNTEILDDDELNGSTGTFVSLSGLTNNIGSYFVTDSQGATLNPHGKLKLTVEGLTEAPANGEYFLIMGARSRP